MPTPAPAGGGVEGDADGRGLAEQAQAAAAGQARGHGRVQGHGRVGVDDAQRRRADHAHAVGPGLPDQLALPGQAAFAVVREPGRGDHDALDPGRRAVLHHLGDFLVRDGDDGQLDRVRHFGEPGEGQHAGEFEGLRIDGVDRAGEAAFNDVFEQLVAHGAPFAAGTDHGNRRRRQQLLDAARLGAVLA